MSALRIGIHYHIPSLRREDGAILMPGYLGRFVDSLAERCDSVLCFFHLAESHDAPCDYRLKSRNVQLVSLARRGSVPDRILHGRAMVEPIRAHREAIDVMLIRGPSPLLPEVGRAVQPLPVSLLLVGDYAAGVDSLPQPRWRKELIRVWSRWNRRGQDRLAAISLVFVNSRHLYRQYQGKARVLVETRTTTLRDQDFVLRSDACSSPPYRVLYTGRMDSAKGLLDIAEAVRLLADRGHDVVFDLVGWPQPGDDIVARLKRYAENHNIQLTYHGFKPVGPELFTFYQEADVYVIASHSEGFPRTIWEAFAHSLPVVATGVGSIPDFLTDGSDALIVRPSAPAELAASIERIITDTELRAKMVSTAFQLAKDNTVGRRADAMVAELKSWIAAARAR